MKNFAKVLNFGKVAKKYRANKRIEDGSISGGVGTGWMEERNF